MSLKSRNWISYSIFIIQCLDILIHLLTNQFELIRVIASLLIMGWVLLFKSYTNKNLIKPITSMTLSIYIILNTLFIFENGWINPSNQRIRYLLFGFIVVTVILVLIEYSIHVKENYGQ